MYLYEGDGQLQLLVDRPSWYEMSIKVFEGDFTVEADKHTLVEPVMGLWYMSLLNENHADNAFLKELVHEHKEAVFPQEYFKDFIEPLETRVEEETVSRRLSQIGHRDLIQAHSNSSTHPQGPPSQARTEALSPSNRSHHQEEESSNGSSGICV